jgi:hypothetical protein
MKRKTKDTLGTYAGLGLAIGTGLTGIAASMPTAPAWVMNIGIILTVMSGALMGWLTGKKVQP